jgi:hypothetical protein
MRIQILLLLQPEQSIKTTLKIENDTLFETFLKKKTNYAIVVIIG